MVSAPALAARFLCFGQGKPKPRFGDILFDSLALDQHAVEENLPVRMTFCRGGADQIARDATAFEIEIAEIARRLGISERAGAAKPMGGLRQILIDAFALLEIGGERMLGAGVVLLGRGANHSAAAASIAVPRPLSSIRPISNWAMALPASASGNSRAWARSKSPASRANMPMALSARAGFDAKQNRTMPRAAANGSRWVGELCIIIKFSEAGAR